MTFSISGWVPLYLMFGLVGLWLLAEVFLQYKARLLWRVMAFLGFVTVVMGVLGERVVVIGVGAAGFAVGQSFVTIAFRRGYTDGWTVNRRRQRTGKESVTPPAMWLTDVAAWILPASDRCRYSEEWRSELWDLATAPRRHQIAHALRNVICAWPTRRGVLQGQRRMAGGR
ncbi:hypothetical protein ACWDLL_14110 [Streptomyces griseoincarnatus]|uniref:hypothetical protein n=1 Tax=Streptomyces TaxID=1883 RepID=UPI001430C0F6|nr:hypothetical protein [Streptomyces sp. 2BBP-J2]NIL50523.1 hypothetical protein [Streptomyces sp. 2BBP-J2]